MTLEEFKDLMQREAQPPSHLSQSLQALWHAAKEDWEMSHQIAQEIHTAEGSWIHAYLHRVEGDQSNADYWYARSGHPRPKVGLDQEWEEMVTALL